ncbi:MAG TPA: UDP-3-O-acyl-N-acetylglucosamine deacetylase [Alphaproteobacteria bacterium]|jgi:UDP-3-O-[3-hydroxymyristoyl] N-acetylglucosamine deacetylase|nr:UDP-3-O-acyl-N-acetylglucosamine deacetylase [Alphaproteobacteria bacterium]
MTLGAYGLSSTLQHTLKNAISCTGTGLHSGTKVTMTLCPAAPDTGIVFRRTDAAACGVEIAARWDNVVDTHLNTTIGNADGVKVGTIEHLMAALSGCAVDNAIVEIDGPEIPIMDGSAAPFVFLIECAGTVEQNRPRRAIEIVKPVSVRDDKRMAVLAPGGGFSVSVEIDFDSALVARQKLEVNLVNGAFRSEIARARTFGFDHEVEQLRAMGLARGGSLDNAVVVSGDRILNADGLRYDDEFVRHKVLDSIGDLYLAGAVIIGHFHGIRCGHSLNNKLLRSLFAQDDAWRPASLESRAVIGGGMTRRAAAASPA